MMIQMYPKYTWIKEDLGNFYDSKQEMICLHENLESRGLNYV